jgi:hypothetical protein
MPAAPGSPCGTWPVPSVARAKGTWLGALDLGRFLPPPTLIDEACNVHHDFPTELQKPMEDLVDAFLYIGPQDLRLRDQMPADLALDIDYRLELQRRGSLPGFPGPATGTLKEFDQSIPMVPKTLSFSYLSHETPSFRIPGSSVWCKVASTSRAVVERPITFGGMFGLNLARTDQPVPQVRASSLDVLSHNNPFFGR